MRIIKYIGILFVVLVFSTNNFANNIESPFSEISITTAKEIASAQGKYIFIDFYADWCVPCKWMDETTYADKGVINTLKSNFIPVKVNIDDFDGYTLKAEYNIKVLPTLLVIDPNGKVIKRYEESLSPGKLKDVLMEIADNSTLEYNENITPEDLIKNDIKTNDNRTIENPVTVKTNKSYRVQVGVFTDYANTVKLIDNLNLKFDEPVIIINGYLNNKTVYKVVIGDYENYDNAEILKSKINEQFGIEGIIKTFE